MSLVHLCVVVIYKSSGRHLRSGSIDVLHGFIGVNGLRGYVKVVCPSLRRLAKCRFVDVCGASRHGSCFLQVGSHRPHALLVRMSREIDDARRRTMSCDVGRWVHYVLSMLQPWLTGFDIPSRVRVWSGCMWYRPVVDHVSAWSSTWYGRSRLRPDLVCRGRGRVHVALNETVEEAFHPLLKLLPHLIPKLLRWPIGRRRKLLLMVNTAVRCSHNNIGLRADVFTFFALTDSMKRRGASEA